jgi:hypothetical protein
LTLTLTLTIQARSTWPHPRTELLLQLAGFPPSLLLGLSAVRLK